MKNKILIGCEESQAVCIAFRELGHEAYSCDLQECSGGHPEWHLQMDVFEAIELIKPELGIFHPPCTYLSCVGMANNTRQPERKDKTELALQFVKKIWASPIPKMCIENPISVLSTRFMKPTQIIQPYYFGDYDMKTTCLWLRGLKRLNGKLEVAYNPKSFKPAPYKIYPSGRKQYWEGKVGDESKRSERGKAKSKTFPGIALAMAVQWGKIISPR